MARGGLGRWLGGEDCLLRVEEDLRVNPRHVQNTDFAMCADSFRVGVILAETGGSTELDCQ